MRANLQRARDAAARLLLCQSRCSLRVDVQTLRYEQLIRFDTMQQFCARSKLTMGELQRHADMQDGCTLIKPLGDRILYLVLYNEETVSTRRRAFTLAHEVGHICLAHEDDAPGREEEANCFAAELLMPRILVHALAWRSMSPLSPEQLCSIFCVSRQAAALCLAQNCFGEDRSFSSLEQAVLERFGGLLPSSEEPIVEC